MRVLPNVREIMATRARATFRYRINFQTIGYENKDRMKLWCHDNCRGLWRAEMYHALYFQFEEEQDATVFMLRWGTAEGNELK